MKSKARVRSKYDSSTVKYGKSKVPYGNFFLAPTVLSSRSMIYTRTINISFNDILTYNHKPYMNSTKTRLTHDGHLTLPPHSG